MIALRGGPRARTLVPVWLGVLAAIVLVATSDRWLGLGPDASPGASAVALAPVDGASAAPSVGASAAPSVGSPTASPTPGPPATAGSMDVALVPVIGYRLGWTSTDGAEVADVLGGRSERYSGIEVTAADRTAIVARLGVAASLPGGASQIRTATDAATLMTDLDAHDDRLGFLRADTVEPRVRAIGWEGAELFGALRVRGFTNWPLMIAVPRLAIGVPMYLPAAAWSLVAGGDINLDGAVAYAIKQKGLGVDYPWDGGTVDITSRYCCSRYGFELARVRRTGNAGAVRALLSGADLAIANFENPAPNRFTYHPGGFTFTADPALIEGLRNAGIDWVSLANNHIGNAGDAGIIQTMTNLDGWGIAHGGAGVDLAGAREPSLLHAGGVTIAILAYDTIKPAYAAGQSSPGSNQMTAARVRADVAAARAAGANVVIVFPHWGIEYSAVPTARQRELAHAAIDAGADLVLGNHTHWVGGMEVYKGKPIVYSLADFVFNIDRSEKTMEGILVDATFLGSRLMQLRIDPLFIVDHAQPNLLDPAGSGKAVMDQLFGASKGLLPW